MSKHLTAVFALLCLATFARSDPANFDAATAFGARPDVEDLSLSPDGKSLAYLTPIAGQGSALFTLDLAAGSKPRMALAMDGKPERLAKCNWVSNERLVCMIYGIVQDIGVGFLRVSRVVAVDRSGSGFKQLSVRSHTDTQGYLISGGQVVDWLPDETNAVLMTRYYLPESHLNSNIASTAEGLGVDWVDTATMRVKTVESPLRFAVVYLSDGRGTIRVMATEQHASGEQTGKLHYLYRKQGSREWLPLSDYNEVSDAGFRPVAVSHDLNIAYGFKLIDRRKALYSIALDGSLAESEIVARADVDVDGLLKIGRRQRVVGTSYATDARRAVFLDPAVEALQNSFARALPKTPQIDVVDSSVDEQVLLIHAASDNDAGVYYVFDRQKKELQTSLVNRAALEGVRLAEVRAVTYPAADGVRIPAYLTLPPGASSAKGLPAIVLPHGGPTARDEWGFNWLPQFYAARGFAVLQPNYRGSSGYGELWQMKNGFRSWRVAVGDVLDAGRWLVSEGIADPSKLCVVGWSYGGYAALQSAVVDPTVFKAVVAIAPVTDLELLKEQYRHFTNYQVMSDQIGDDALIGEASPARHADKIKVPVLLFHGEYDGDVGIIQSQTMDAKLKAAGVPHELVTWNNLDHHLEDSSARAMMLRKSDEFLRRTIGMPP